jgi:3-phenylpropionate/cinnamic acid dioxygenase small subunit
MADRGAIDQLFSEYGVAIDDQDWALFDKIFVEDAVWRWERHGSEPVEKRGIVAIKDFLPGSRATGQPRHIFTNLRLLREDEDSATATMYMTFAVTEGGMFQVVMTSVYTVDVVRTPSGWRFSEMSHSSDRHVG